MYCYLLYIILCCGVLIGMSYNKILGIKEVIWKLSFASSLCPGKRDPGRGDKSGLHNVAQATAGVWSRILAQTDGRTDRHSDSYIPPNFVCGWYNYFIRISSVFTYICWITWCFFQYLSLFYSKLPYVLRHGFKIMVSAALLIVDKDRIG